jgi:hypothetical protein
MGAAGISTVVAMIASSYPGVLFNSEMSVFLSAVQCRGLWMGGIDVAAM